MSDTWRCIMADNPFRIGQRPAGFRILVSDLIAALFAIVTTWFLWHWLEGDEMYQTLVLMPLVVLGHFFLFCNVFRVPRKLELAWGVIFIIVVFVHLVLSYTSGHAPKPSDFWGTTIVFQLPATVTVITWPLFFSKDYHGIGYKLHPCGRKINKHEEEQS